MTTRDPFIVSREDLRLDDRKPGISGFLRAKNEAQFLRSAVESHLPYLDELIIVHNDCTDATPDIALELEREHPEKVKVAAYLPEVELYSSRNYADLDDESPHSLANYYNFSLCQTSYQIAAKIDADHIPIGSAFLELVNHVRAELQKDQFLGFSGINWYPIRNSIFIKREDALTFGDHGFFFPNEKTWHYYDRENGYEVMPVQTAGLSFDRWQGAVFHHLKCFRQAGAYASYDTSNPESNVHRVAQADAERTRSGVMSLWEAQRRLPDRFPEPFDVYAQFTQDHDYPVAGSPGWGERVRTYASLAKCRLTGTRKPTP